MKSIKSKLILFIGIIVVIFSAILLQSTYSLTTSNIEDSARQEMSLALYEIISPFTRRLSLGYLNLTPTEIQIANMTKHGNTSKKIAKIMNISPRTVDTHKKNIRRKIDLEDKRANLRSYLLSLH